MYKKELTLKIVFNSQGNQADAITGLKRNPKNRNIYRSGILKEICKVRENLFFHRV